LPVEYFYVDEAQDLSPLQFQLVQIFSYDCEELIFGFDEHQAIYFFNAAAPTLMKDIYTEKKVLSRSYRLPLVVWEHARRILRKVGDRDSEQVECREGGFFSVIDYEDTVALISGLAKTEKKVFILFRTHDQLKRFRERCIAGDILLKGMGRAKSFIDDPRFLAFFNILYQEENGLEIRKSDIKEIVPCIPAKYFKRRGLKEKLKKKFREGEIDAENVYTLLRKEFFSIIEDPKFRLLEDQKENERARDILLTVGRYLLPSGVQIGTYFASKGLECDVSLAFDYLPDAKWSEYPECCLAYVGLTRCREGDFLISPEGCERGFISDLVL